MRFAGLLLLILALVAGLALSQDKPPKAGAKKPPAPAADKPKADKPTAPEKKVPTPDQSAQDRSLADIRETFHIIDARTPEQKLALADKLFDTAVNEKSDMVGRYVCLKLTLDYASDWGNPDLAFKVLEEMDRSFVIDLAAMRFDALSRLMKSARSPADVRAMVVQITIQVDKTLGVERYDLLPRMTEMFRLAAVRTQDQAMLKVINDRVLEIREIEGMVADYKRSSQTFDKDPTNPRAVLSIGRFHCLVRGDWDRGLPLLAQSDDAILKAMAQQDLMKPITTRDQLSVGDGWWDASRREKGIAARQMRQRAAYWYRLARPQLEALSRAKVDDRLAKVDADNPGALPPPSAKDDPPKPAGETVNIVTWNFTNDPKTGDVKVVDGNARLIDAVMRSPQEFKVPLRIDFVAQTSASDLIVYFGAKGNMVFNPSDRSGDLLIHDPASGDLRVTRAKGKISNKDFIRFGWVIQEDRMIVYVNDEERVVLPGKYKNLAGNIGIGTAGASVLTVKAGGVTPLVPRK